MFHVKRGVPHQFDVEQPTDGRVGTIPIFTCPLRVKHR